MGKLDGKVAMVTDSGRGIGQAIALKLATEGGPRRHQRSRRATGQKDRRLDQ